MARLGSSLWGKANNGGLSWTDKLRFASSAVWVQIRMLGEKSFSKEQTLTMRRLSDIESQFAMPDSTIVLNCTQQIDDLLPEWLVHHSLRTWCWAVAIGSLEQIQFDREALALACLLHDVELIPSNRDQKCDCCFAILGGNASRRFLNEEKVEDDELIDKVEEAICMHMNASVGLADGAEAYLLHEAASLDVVGARIQRLPTSLLQLVVQRHPRVNFENYMVDAMQKEALRFGSGRVALLWKLGFKSAIEHSAWQQYSTGRNS